MKYVHDEEEKIRQILSDGFESNPPSYYEILLLAKHYRINNRFGQRGIQKAIVETLSKFGIEEFYEDEIIRASRKALSYTSYKKPIFPIPVYGIDISLIEDIQDFKYQKIILSTIVFSRATGNPKSFYLNNHRTMRHIISMSNTRVSVYEYKQITNMAFNKKIFKNNYFRSGDGYSLMFEPEGEIIIQIYDDTYLNVGNVYRDYIGGTPGWCGVCGDRFIKTGRNNKYCKRHSDEMRKEKIRNRVEKHSKNNES